MLNHTESFSQEVQEKLLLLWWKPPLFRAARTVYFSAGNTTHICSSVLLLEPLPFDLVKKVFTPQFAGTEKGGLWSIRVQTLLVSKSYLGRSFLLKCVWNLTFQSRVFCKLEGIEAVRLAIWKLLNLQGMYFSGWHSQIYRQSSERDLDWTTEDDGSST